MSDIVEFVLARITEAEAAAHYAMSRGSLTDGADSVLAGQWIGWVEHAELWMPARVLADCEAKRRIVRLYRLYENAIRFESENAKMADPLPKTLYAVRNALKVAVRLLASVDAGHPDFDETWRA